MPKADLALFFFMGFISVFLPFSLLAMLKPTS